MATQYTIYQTVGKFAKNDWEDVKATKHVLNRIIGTTFDESDGSVSERFNKGILVLQTKFVPKAANGVIDPWGPTVNKINELLPMCPAKPKLVHAAKGTTTIAKTTANPKEARAGGSASVAKGKSLWDTISPAVSEDEIRATLEAFRKKFLAVVARCLLNRTEWKLETTGTLSGGVGVFGGQVGKVVVKQTVTGETKDLFVASGGGGKSILPGNINFSTTDFRGTGIGNLYRGPNRKSALKPEDLDGIFFEVTANVAPLPVINTGGSLADAANTIGLSAYFFGLSTVLVSKAMTTTELGTILKLLDNCSAMGIMWGTAIGLQDANVGIQLGKAVLAGSIAEGVKRLANPLAAVNL